MDVYLVPIGPDGYELYCEPLDLPAAEMPASSGWRLKATRLFRSVLTYLEQERERRASARVPHVKRTWWDRLRDRGLVWLAERVAEQRLLWRLRSVPAAKAYYPDDLLPDAARDIVGRSLKRDGRRHGRWVGGNVLGYLVALPFSVLPGPNLPCYYFVFRAVGHYLSWLGARHGLRTVQWEYAACQPLTALRRLPSLPVAERGTFAHDVAERLHLERIDTFAERMALGGGP
jgi:hypothetical protein